MMRITRGFTLIELMVVVVVIGILAAIAIPNYIALKNRALEASVKSNMHSAHAATEEFNTLAGGVYPGDIDTKVNDVDPSIIGTVGDKSLAAGVRVPPFPDNALLRPHPGFKNPFNATFEVIDNLPVPMPPIPPDDFQGCIYYSGYAMDGTTPSVAGDPASHFIISGYGSDEPLHLTLP